MLRYLIPIIAVLSNVQAADFPSPVNVQFISDLVDNDHPVYFWKDMTEYRNNHTEGISNPPIANAKPEVVGNLNFTHANDWTDRRNILIYKDANDYQECTAWLSGNPGSSQLSYKLNKKNLANLNGDDNQLDRDAFHFECSDAEPEDSETVLANSVKIQVKGPLIITFFADPNNLMTPYFWKDLTEYPKLQAYIDVGHGLTDAMQDEDKTEASVDGQQKLGQMKYTQISKWGRQYIWQAKNADPVVLLKQCDFNVTGDPGIAELYVFVDSEKMEARRDGKALEGQDQETALAFITKKCEVLKGQDAEEEEKVQVKDVKR